MVLLFAMAMFSACAPKSSEGNGSEGDVPVADNVAENDNDGTFETAMTLTEEADALNIRFTLTNPTAEEKMITYPSGQTFDYQILNEAGENVYTWSANKSFIEALSEVSIPAGEAIVHEEQFDYNNMSGEPFEAGNYTLVFSTGFYVDEEMQTYVESGTFVIE